MIPASASNSPPPPAQVREGVRELLTASSAFQSQPPETRTAVANSLVRIASTALALAQAEPQAHAPLAQAQNAGREFSGVAADRVASTTQRILNAVSFPRFVTELINGVFRAMNDSNQQQMHSYVELIQNVAATTEGFADTNTSVAGARAWLAERFPGAFVVQGDEPEAFPTPASEMTAEERAEQQSARDAATRLQLASGASMPSAAALRTVLGLGPQDEVPTGDPERLVPLARSCLARNRQQMLATMVMMGLQRIVIESGRLNASMRFHIDTRSAANDDRGSSLDERNDLSVGVGAKVGPWGIDARMQNTIAYVSTQRTQTSEEMNTDLDLNSSVELLFRTDHVDLERLAGGQAQDRIRVNAINPEAEARMASEDRRARITSQSGAETARSGQMSGRLTMPAQAGPVHATVPGSGESGSTTTAPDASTGTTTTGGTSTTTGGTTTTGSAGTASPPPPAADQPVQPPPPPPMDRSHGLAA